MESQPENFGPESVSSNYPRNIELPDGSFVRVESRQQEEELRESLKERD